MTRSHATSLAVVAAFLIASPNPRAQNLAESAPTVSLPWKCLGASAPAPTTTGVLVPDPACGAYSAPGPPIHLALRSLSSSGAIVVPVPPTSLTATLDGQAIVFAWNAPASGDPSTSYVLEAGSAPGKSDLGQLDTRSAARTLHFTDVPSGSYFVRVRARTTSGTSSASNEIAFSIGTRDCGSKPLAPTGLQGSVAGTTILLRWQPATGGCPATSYLIEAGAQFGLSDVAAILTGDPATSFTWTNAPNGSYVVRVKSVNATGVGSGTDGLRVTVPGAAGPACSVVPSPPTQLAANVFGSTVTLSWNPALGSPTSYVVEAGSAPGLNDVIVSDTVSAITSMAVTAARGTYYFRLRARNTCGTSAAGNEIVVVVGGNPAAPVSPSMPLVGEQDLVYDGSFRLPAAASGVATFAYGGTALAFNPAHNSLFVVGHDWYQQVAEVSIPAIFSAAPAGGTPSATLLQPLTDATEGRLNLVNPGDVNAKKIGGILPYGGRLYFSAYSYYDGSETQVLSHFVSSQNLAAVGDVQGPFQVGTAPIKAGYVSGYMGIVPQAWRAALGGPAFTGNCCLAITGRTSQGPAMSTFDPSDVGVKSPVPASALLFYDTSHPLGGGGWGVTSPLYNGTTQIHGVVMPEGTSSVLFFGRHGIGRFCYGAGTTNQSLDGTLTSDGVTRYCFDPEDANKGTHGYPYIYQVWAYDANDLAASKNGQRLPWDIKPYAIWALDLPTPSSTTHLNGAAYDPQTQRIFLSQAAGDGDKPMIHVYSLRFP